MAKRSARTGKSLLSALKKKNPLDPIYYIYGDDPYLIREIVEQLKSYIQPAFKDFNFHQVTAGEAQGDQIASLAKQLPVMDKQTMILVRNANQLAAGHWKQLVPYLEDPSPTTCLVFLAPESTSPLDSRMKAGKLIKSNMIACLKPYENKIPDWIRERVRQNNLQMSPNGVSRLIDLLGADLTGLNNAIERLSLYIGGQGEITVEIIDEVIAADKKYNVFDLSGLVGRKDLENALKTLHGLMGAGHAPLGLLALLARAFRQLLRARVEMDQGATHQDLDKYIHKNLRYKRHEHLNKFVQQVKIFTRNELASAIIKMQKTDKALKSTSGLSAEILMEKLIMDLCQKHA